MLDLSLSIPATAARIRTGTYEGASEAYFGAMTSQPDATRKGHLNTLVLTLKSSGIWAKLDVLYLLAAHDEQAARLNLVNPSQALTAVNSPTFTADEGFAGDAISMHLIGPAAWTSLTQFTLNSNHVGTWIGGGTDAAADKWSVGHVAGSNLVGIRPRAAAGTVLIANAGGASSFGASATIIGHFVGVRRGASATEGYRNGASLGDDTDASTVNSPQIMSVNRTNTVYANFLVRVMHAGSQLSDAEVTALYDALNTYLTAIEASP